MTHRISNTPLLVFIFVVVAVSVGALYHQVRKNTAVNGDAEEDQRRVTLSIQPDDYVYGDPTADVILFEYADTECPFCKRLHIKVKNIVAEYAAKNIPVTVIYRHAPLGIWDKSVTEAHAAECVGAEQSARGYYAFLNELYEATPSDNGLDLNILPGLAQAAGADTAAFAACMDSLMHIEKIKDQKLSSAALGVNTIPHLFIVGKKHIYEVVGNKPKDTITFLIDHALYAE